MKDLFPEITQNIFGAIIEKPEIDKSGFSELCITDEKKALIAELYEKADYLWYSFPLAFKRMQMNGLILENTGLWLASTGSEKSLGILYIFSLEREKGNASKVMKIMCDLADKYSITLELEAASTDEKNGRKNKELLAWYNRYGFTGTKEMIRQPK